MSSGETNKFENYNQPPLNFEQLDSIAVNLAALCPAQVISGYKIEQQNHNQLWLSSEQFIEQATGREKSIGRITLINGETEQSLALSFDKLEVVPEKISPEHQWVFFKQCSAMIAYGGLEPKEVTMVRHVSTLLAASCFGQRHPEPYMVYNPWASDQSGVEIIQNLVTRKKAYTASTKSLKTTLDTQQISIDHTEISDIKSLDEELNETPVLTIVITQRDRTLSYSKQLNGNRQAFVHNFDTDVVEVFDIEENNSVDSKRVHGLNEIIARALDEVVEEEMELTLADGIDSWLK